MQQLSWYCPHTHTPTPAIKIILTHSKTLQNCQLYDIKKGRLLDKRLGYWNDCRHKEHGMHMIRCQGRFSAIPGKAFFWLPRIHAINATSGRLNARTVQQPCPQVLFSIITHSTEMLGCSWALFWSERTLPETKPSCSFGNLLKRPSQNAARTRLNQFWLPLRYTNVQS